MLTKYEAIIATATVSASGANSFLARPGSSSTGSSTAMVVSVEASTGSATALVPCSAACVDAHALPLVPVDRLQHHHRVVDQPAHGQGQAAQGEGVERLARGVEDERVMANDSGMATETISVPRTLCRNSRMTSGDEDQGLDDLLLEAVVGGAHEGGLVEDRRGPRRPGGRSLQVCDGLLDGVDDLDGVAAGDAQHVQVDRVLAVDRDRLRLGRAAVLDPGHVADEHRLRRR